MSDTLKPLIGTAADRPLTPGEAESAFDALFEGEALSEPVLAFLLHQHSWAQRHARWEKEKGDYDWGARTNWPAAFSMECEQTYQKLLDRRARLVAEGK